MEFPSALHLPYIILKSGSFDNGNKPVGKLDTEKLSDLD